MSIQELAIKKAFNLLAQTPVIAKQKAYLYFLRDQMAVLLYERARLLQKIKDLEQQNEFLIQEKAERENSAEFIDIGPVFIKKSKFNYILDGFYCLKCRMLMSRDDYSTSSGIYKDIFYCEVCKGSFFIKGELVDKAFKQYVEEHAKQEHLIEKP